MASIDPRGKRRFGPARGNGAGHRGEPGDVPTTSLEQPAVAEPDRAAAASERPAPGSALTAAKPWPAGRRGKGETSPPDQAPGPAQLMPRRRPGRSSKEKAAKDLGKVSRPKGPRGAGHEERQEGPAWLAQQAERDRALPARRQGAPARRGGYVMGVANPCWSCGLAVWVAGKDAGGHWVKVNLDGSPHVCGAPMGGLGRFSMPLALPPGPQVPPPSVASHPAAPPPWPTAQPVADQGRVWVERFMVGVALVALVFLATIPRDIRSGLSAPRGEAQPASAAPAATGPDARPEPPKKETFSIGSTEDDVMAVMGPPREIYDNRWWYGSSYVDFHNGRVVNFYNGIHGDLKVKMQGAAQTTRPAYLTKGLTKDEILSLQGTPTRLAGNRWYYGSSYVDFRGERVVDYFNGVLRELKIPPRSATQ